MPLIRGKNYYQYGPSGHRYYYIPGDKNSRSLAKYKAFKQGQAIEISRHGLSNKQVRK